MEKPVNEKEKAAILEKILKDKSRVVRVAPQQGYSGKLQTLYSNKVKK